LTVADRSADWSENGLLDRPATSAVSNIVYAIFSHMLSAPAGLVGRSIDNGSDKAGAAVAGDELSVAAIRDFCIAICFFRFLSAFLDGATASTRIPSSTIAVVIGQCFCLAPVQNAKLEMLVENHNVARMACARDKVDWKKATLSEACHKAVKIYSGSSSNRCLQCIQSACIVPMEKIISE
jgi:hypothetical protein